MGALMGEERMGEWERRCLCLGSEWGVGRAGTWTGCQFDNLGLGLAGLLKSGLFCNHLVSASVVLGELNSPVIELALVR